MLRIAPEARYFSMPSADAGWVVLSSSGFELLPMFPINDPLADCLNMLASGDRRGVAHERQRGLSAP